MNVLGDHYKKMRGMHTDDEHMRQVELRVNVPEDSGNGHSLFNIFTYQNEREKE